MPASLAPYRLGQGSTSLTLTAVLIAAGLCGLMGPEYLLDAGGARAERAVEHGPSATDPAPEDSSSRARLGSIPGRVVGRGDTPTRSRFERGAYGTDGGRPARAEGGNRGSGTPEDRGLESGRKAADAGIETAGPAGLMGSVAGRSGAR